MPSEMFVFTVHMYSMLYCDFVLGFKAIFHNIMLKSVDYVLTSVLRIDWLV